MPVIEIKNCTECLRWKSKRHLGALSESKCSVADRDIDAPFEGVPDWCPLAPKKVVAEDGERERLWLVTCTTRALIAAENPEDAEEVYALYHDYDYEVRVEGPIEETNHIDDGLDYDLDEPPFNGSRPLRDYLMDVDDGEEED